MGLLLLILLFVFQVIAPSASAGAATVNAHVHHQEMTDAVNISDPEVAERDQGNDDVSQIDVKQDHAGNCMPSMCCFQDNICSFKLVNMWTALPITQLIDRGEAASSISESSQDRPPRHV